MNQQRLSSKEGSVDSTRKTIAYNGLRVLAVSEQLSAIHIKIRTSFKKHASNINDINAEWRSTQCYVSSDSVFYCLVNLTICLYLRISRIKISRTNFSSEFVRFVFEGWGPHHHTTCSHTPTQTKRKSSYRRAMTRSAPYSAELHIVPVLF